MQDFTLYNYNINLSDVMQVLADAMQAGHMPQIVINGEYYDIIKEGSASHDNRANRKHFTIL